MRHFIIVKFHESVDWQQLIVPVRELFSKCTEIEGVENVGVFPCNLDLPNRYDLMIELKLSYDAWKRYDVSDIHKIWKNQYGKYIKDKTIFDCES